MLLACTIARTEMGTCAAETRTFLLTDIEGSTNLLAALGERYEGALIRHRDLLREVTEANAGEVVDSYGDGFFAAFGRAADAVAAAVDGQRRIAKESWPGGVQLKVRMGLHSGSAARSGHAYVGLDVHKAARIMAAAHGGQILLSSNTAALVEDDLPGEVGLLNLGPRRLKDLARPANLFQVEAAGLRVVFDAPRTLDVRANNLPYQSTPFVGREAEITEASSLLRASRLLTLTGAGGTGKTRLALQLAAESIDHFHDGVFLVSLAAVTDPDHLPAAIASALEVRTHGSEAVLNLLQRRLETSSLLLVLDNFEQIVNAATTVTGLLACCRELKIVVTSREPLHVTGEQEYPVRPLGIPDLDDLGPPEALSRCEAVELFVQRSRAVCPEFTLSERNARTVAEICVRLDGLPLSIELAAARMKFFTPGTLLERLGKRIGTLSGGPRDLPERQRTLRNTLDWSYNLLSEPEKRLFVRLGVFVGRFSLESAEHVCASANLPPLDGTVAEGIESLLNKSLVHAGDGEPDDEPWFWLLETIREYATELLRGSPEEAQVRTAHASFFAELTELFNQAQANPEAGREEDARGIRMVGAVHENINAALEWTTGPGDVRDAYRMVANLFVFYFDQGLWNECAAWVRRLAGREAGIEPKYLMQVHRGTATAAEIGGDWRKAKEEYLTTAELAREAGDQDTEVVARLNSILSIGPDDTWPEESKSILDREIESAKNTGSNFRRLFTLMVRGYFHRAHGRFDEAAADYREVLALDMPTERHGALISMGLCEVRLDRMREAEPRFRRVLDEEREGSASPLTISRALIGMAAVSTDPVRAVRLLAASQAVRARIGLAGVPVTQAEYDFIAKRVKSGLDAEEYERAWVEGEQMKMEAAVEYALREEICDERPAGDGE